MRKKIILFLVLLIFMSGCSVVRINTSDIDNIIDVVLSKDNKLYNRTGLGFKYYVPKGVTYIDSNELNDKLYSDGNYYYLFVDSISYYYNIEPEYIIDNGTYYSRIIKTDGKEGYVQINKVNDKYFIEFYYNYSKIEAMVDKEDINNVILDASYILSTVKYNKSAIKLMLNDDIFKNREEKYDRYTSKKDSENFLEYVEDVDKENKR